MKIPSLTISIIIMLFIGCKQDITSVNLTQQKKDEIKSLIQQNINDGLEATRNKDIETYISRLPEDLLIYDESGEIISREKQKEYALRDWAIIDTTLAIKMDIDSITYLSSDSVHVFTSQRWERMMFQRDGITTDTVVTTQLHRETWKLTKKGWFGYEIKELGGEIFINGVKYQPEY